MNSNCTSCCSSGDSSLWLLMIAFALSGKDFHLDHLLDSDNLPVMLALLYCLCKSGCLSSLLNDLLGACGGRSDNDSRENNCNNYCNCGNC